jgi:hypothetical protein
MSQTDRGHLEVGRAGENEPVRKKFLDELHDAVSLRTFLLVFGVLLLQLGFILSYVGAFHSPRPVRIPRRRLAIRPGGKDPSGVEPNCLAPSARRGCPEPVDRST